MKGKRAYLIAIWSVTAVCVVLGTMLHIVSPFDHLLFGQAEETAANLQNTSTGFSKTDAFHTIEMNITVSDVVIAQGDNYGISVTAKNGQKNPPSWDVQDDTLRVRQPIRQRKFGIFSLGQKTDSKFDVKVTVPEGTTLDGIQIDSGTGNATLNGITADALTADLGTGMLTITDCTLKTLDVDGGTGSVTASLATAPREVRIDCGTGDVALTLPGEETDYGLKLETGTGKLTVGDETHRHEYKSDHADDAMHMIRIDTGTGDVTVNFE